MQHSTFHFLLFGLFLTIQLSSAQFQFGLNFSNILNSQQQTIDPNNFFGSLFLNLKPNINQNYNPQNQYSNNPFLQNQNQWPPPPQRPPVINQNRPINYNQNQPIVNNNRPAVPTSPTGRPIVQTNSNFNERISERKCKEYARKTGTVQLVGSLSLDSSVQDINLQKCDSSIGLVVGGEDAKTGEFPHMVAIGYPQEFTREVVFFCGGSLISEKFVLTAAHCRKVGREKPTIVRVGDLNLALPDQGLPELDILIEEFISHEGYRSNNNKNDIALIRLKNNVEFSKYVHPACLAQPNLVVTRKAIASGWGFTEVAGQTADHLQKVDLSLISNSDCSRLLQRLFDKPDDYSVDSTQLCAGELKGGKDTCQGDSGGPLQIPSPKNKCMYILLGVTSYGTPFCGEANSPGVYTRVTSYLDWIEQKVWGT